MNQPTPSPKKLNPLDSIRKLEKLLQQWDLEGFEINILQELANRNRWAKSSDTKLDHSDKWSADKISKGTETGINKQEKNINAWEIIKAINEWRQHFLIYWTNGRSAWHEPQYTSFTVDKNTLPASIFDDSSGISDTLRDDNTIMWIRLSSNRNFPDHTVVLTIRISDNRTDHRWWSHTTVAIFLPKTMSRKDVEKLAQDTNGLKWLVKTVLEKGNSPLRWAEENVKRSFLV